MRKSFATLAALVLATSSASAAVIDDFSAPSGGQTVTQTTIGSNSQTLIGLGSSVIGGTRQVNVTITSFSAVGVNGSASVKIQNPSAGAAEINADSNTDATETFGYGTTSDLNVDLTNGGLSNAFIIRLLLTDLPSLANANSITVSTTGGGSSTATFTIPGLVGNGNPSPFDVVVPYASFTGTANFTDLDTIGLAINGPRSSDYTFDFISTNSVPEPASLSLFAVGAMGVLSRRKRA